MKFRFDPKFLVSVLAIVTWLCLYACGGGDGISHATPSENEKTALIGMTGGVIEFTDPNSPLYKVKVEIPTNCLSEDVLVTVSHAEKFADEEFVPLKENASEIIEIKVEKQAQFNSPILVTIPYKHHLSFENFQVYYRDEILSKPIQLYSGQIIDKDAAKGTVTFSVNHLCYFGLIKPRPVIIQGKEYPSEDVIKYERGLAFIQNVDIFANNWQQLGISIELNNSLHSEFVKFDKNLRDIDIALVDGLYGTGQVHSFIERMIEIGDHLDNGFYQGMAWNEYEKAAKFLWDISSLILPTNPLMELIEYAIERAWPVYGVGKAFALSVFVMEKFLSIIYEASMTAFEARVVLTRVFDVLDLIPMGVDSNEIMTMEFPNGAVLEVPLFSEKIASTRFPDDIAHINFNVFLNNGVRESTLSGQKVDMNEFDKYFDSNAPYFFIFWSSNLGRLKVGRLSAPDATFLSFVPGEDNQFISDYFSIPSWCIGALYCPRVSVKSTYRMGTYAQLGLHLLKTYTFKNWLSKVDLDFQRLVDSIYINVDLNENLLVELCGDNIDNNSNGLVDENCEQHTDDPAGTIIHPFPNDNSYYPMAVGLEHVYDDGLKYMIAGTGFVAGKLCYFVDHTSRDGSGASRLLFYRQNQRLYHLGYHYMENGEWKVGEFDEHILFNVEPPIVGDIWRTEFGSTYLTGDDGISRKYNSVYEYEVISITETITTSQQTFEDVLHIERRLMRERDDGVWDNWCRTSQKTYLWRARGIGALKLEVEGDYGDFVSNLISFTWQN